MRLVLPRDDGDLLGAQDGRRPRQRLLRGILLQDGIGAVLGLLHVGLIEGVDAEQRARDGRSELPTEELSAQVVAVAQRQRNTGCPAAASARNASSCPGSTSCSVRQETKRRSLPYTSGGPSGSPSTGRMPLPSLPVLSAMSCSIQ